MPEPTSGPASQPSPQRQTPSPAPQATDFHFGDEFDAARRTLPPARTLLICIVAVAVIVALVAYRERAKPQGGGAIDFVTSAEVPGQDMILAAVSFTLRNSTDKPLWVRSLKAQLVTADGKTLEDDAASAVDLDRYYQAFPALKERAQPALSPEAKLAPASEQHGTIIVGFKVKKEEFDRRKSLTVTIQPYDHPVPVILK